MGFGCVAFLLGAAFKTTSGEWQFGEVMPVRDGLSPVSKADRVGEHSGLAEYARVKSRLSLQQDQGYLAFHSTSPSFQAPKQHCRVSDGVLFKSNWCASMNEVVTKPSIPRSKLTLFAYLIVATILATAAMLPALLFLLDPARPKPLFGASGDPIPFIMGFAIANVVVSAVAIVVGLRLEPLVRVGLPLLCSRPVAGRATVLRCAQIAAGLAGGVVLCGVAFRSQLPLLPASFVFPPVWQGILMMLGAAVREEILFRFFALNLLVWIVMRLARRAEPPASIVWAANVLISLAFAAAHLVPASQLLAMNAIASGLAVALAATAGVVLGWVYWRHGLIMAIFAHGICGLLVYLGGRGAIALLQ